jgi:hypothetical protein
MLILIRVGILHLHVLILPFTEPLVFPPALMFDTTQNTSIYGGNFTTAATAVWNYYCMWPHPSPVVLDHSRLHTDTSNYSFSFFLFPPAKFATGDEHRKISEWFFVTDYRVVHNDVSKKREIGTGQWLLLSNNFRGWINNPESRVLWCPGSREWP